MMPLLSISSLFYKNKITPLYVRATLLSLCLH